MNTRPSPPVCPGGAAGGLDALPAAQLDGPELDLRLLVDHRERLIRQQHEGVVLFD